MTAPLGILALQGNTDQHAAVLDRLDVPWRPVRKPAGLADLGGLIIPGGESTTLGRLFDLYGWWEPLEQALREGLPAFGTCMGAILLGTVAPSRQRTLGVLDCTLARNAWGPQTESFRTAIDLTALGESTPALTHFIRAPRFVRTGPAVRVLASVAGEPVLVCQGKLLAATFHPEAAGEVGIHAWFLHHLCGITPDRISEG